jgi:Ca2+-transporting ATPase
VGELTIVLVAALVGWPLLLLPAQLLWINLVTDGLPALALATDSIDPGVLTCPPRPQGVQLLDWHFGKYMALVGCLTAGVTLGAFAYAWYSDGHLEGARTAAFSTLIVAELLRTFGARSERQTVWQIGFFSNRQLCVIVAVSFAMQLAISQITALQQLFGITPISLRQWSAWIVLGAVPLLVLELRKMFSHAREGDDAAPC